MCLPPEVIASVPSVGRRKNARWAVDQRPFIWGAQSLSSLEKASPAWSPWVNTYNLSSTQSGFVKEAGASVAPEVPSDSLQIVASASQEAVQKVWEHHQQPPNWAQATSTINSPFPPVAAMQPFYAAGSGALARQYSAVSDAAVSCISITPMVMSTTQEANEADRTPVDSPSKRSSIYLEDKPRTLSWVPELIRPDDQPPEHHELPTLCSPGGRSVRKQALHSPSVVSSATKKEVATPTSKDVCLSESLSDNEGSDDEDVEAAPVITEKRRKRMLSNRASAQRSRQRRQERLDSLEVLVAQLRVENAALTRKASNAALAAKKFEEENRTLRNQLEKQESTSLSRASFSNDEVSEQTIENKPRIKVGRVRNEVDLSLWRTESKLEAPTEKEESCQNRCLHAQDLEIDCNHSRMKRAKITDEEQDRHMERMQQQPWNNIFNCSLNSMLTEVPAGRVLSRTLPDRRGHQFGRILACVSQQQEYLEMDEHTSLVPQTPVFEDLEPFDMDPHAAEKNVGSAEMWLESLAECLK